MRSLGSDKHMQFGFLNGMHDPAASGPKCPTGTVLKRSHGGMGYVGSSVWSRSEGKSGVCRRTKKQLSHLQAQLRLSDTCMSMVQACLGKLQCAKVDTEAV